MIKPILVYIILWIGGLKSSQSPRKNRRRWKAAKENEALTAEQHSRESIRIARVTRELLKKFAAAFRMFQEMFIIILVFL